VKTAGQVLAEIEKLTNEQRALIALEEKTALEQNLESKERLIESLGEMPDEAFDEEAREILERVARAERENIVLAKDEMERLKTLMKKTQEGMTTVRGYDPFSAGVGATYIDKRK
jgi:ATP-dependent RNA circularization protein (DNA/RNA ligase family)